MLISVAVTISLCMSTGVARRRASAAALLAAGFLAAGATNAQPPETSNAPAESLNVDISGCLDLATREQQIACYLARVDEAVEAHESGVTPARDQGPNDPSSASSRAVETESRRSDPSSAPRGPAQPQSRPQSEAPAAAAASEAPDEVEEREEIVATITSIREVQPNTYVINLDNGQVWRQSAAKRYYLREGAEVHLVPTAWGESYRLTDPDVGNFIQVERVR